MNRNHSTQPQKNSRSQGGSALLVVVGLIAIISGLLAVMTASGTQRAFTARKLSNRVRALLYAEAGANQAYSVIANNWNTRTNSTLFLLTNYGYGTYDVTVTCPTSNVAVIHSTGNCNGEEVNVVLDLENYGPPGSTTPTGPTPGSAWEYTIYSGQRIYLNGNGNIDGSIHANSELRVNGKLDISPNPIDINSSTKIRINGNVDSDGSLTAPTIQITGHNNSGMTVDQDTVPLVAFPEIDLTPYYNIAAANGQIKSAGTYNGDINWSSVPGGVIWINGDVRFKGDFTSDAIVISTGDIRIDGNSNWNPSGGEGGSIISRDGSIKINGNADCEALIYAPGTVTLGGTVQLEGQVIAGGDVYVNGTVDIINYSYTNPGDSGEIVTPGKDLIGVSAWQG